MAVEVFNSWLTKKLESYNIEDEVLGSYISSIITTDDSDSEKQESLHDILSDLLGDVDVDGVCCEILNKWSECYIKSKEQEQKNAGSVIDDLSQKMAQLVGQQVQSIAKQSTRTAEEERIREAILRSCTFVSSEEEDCESDEGGGTTSLSSAQNQNIEAVAQAEKERRNKLKSESDQKKAQDKVSREKQKQKQEERKEKERKRTQKQERRR